MRKHIEQGNIAILDMVKDEITNNDDDLSEWLKNTKINIFVDHKNLIEKYSNILTYIQKTNNYKDSAFSEWANIKEADPWLIAASSVNKYTIVTFENPNSTLGTNNKAKRIKIPDICPAFNAKWKDLFYMMRKLSINFNK